MNKFDYTEPVSKLILCCGLPDEYVEWKDYLIYGFTEKDIPELIRMIKDRRFDSESHYKTNIWAPNHALRVLGLLKAKDAVEDLLYSIAYFRDQDDDNFLSDLSKVISMIGPDTLPIIKKYLRSDYYMDNKEVCSLECLRNLNKIYPHIRSECVEIMIEIFSKYENYDTLYNGFLVANLIRINAVEALPIIRKAFNDGYVDWHIAGDLEDVEIELGVREERETPSPFKNDDDELDNMVESYINYIFEAALDDMPEIYREEKPKISRNAPCVCGSGKKYKKCCMKK